MFWTLEGQFKCQGSRVHHAAVKWASLSRSEDKLVTVSCDRKIAVWSLETLEPLREFASEVGSRVLSFAAS